MQEYGGFPPTAIHPKDNEPLKIAKRAADGGYILAKRFTNFLKGSYRNLRGLN